MTGLDALFRPRSVAIIGASSDPNKVGGRPLHFLQKAGYQGRLLPINPSAAEVQGVRAHRSLSEIQEPVDQAIIAVAGRQVLEVASECIAHGVKALQIFSAGFGDDANDTRLLLERARAAGVRVLGPNNLGLFNAVDGFFGTFATALDGAWPSRGSVGVVTQSGAFGSYFFGMAQRRGLGFSHFVTTGNESDVDVADCIAYLANDADTQVIVTAMEGCRDGRKLASALAAARSAGKLVLAMKVGVSPEGALAAATHTGSLSGEDRVFDAVLRDLGIARAQSLAQLVDAAYLATIGPRPLDRSALVVTTSGGIGVLSADAAQSVGLELPHISDGAHARVKAIACLADGHNPVDTSAGIIGDLSAYARITEAALDGQGHASVVCYMAHIARNPSHWAQLREPLYALRRRFPSVHFAAVLLSDEGTTKDLEKHGFSVFEDPTSAIQAIAACSPLPALSERFTPTADDTPGQTINGPLRTEAECKQALAALGIPFAPERLVMDLDTAVVAAGEVGFPVVLKIVSPDIAHKTEVGGVRVGLNNSSELRAAMVEMNETVHRHVPTARIEGFIVARQLMGGAEILVGTQRDPVFGPVVTVGAGGVLAELLDDVQVRLAPVDVASARDLLGRTRIAARLCEGFRGSAPADLDALAQLVARISQVAWTHRDQIAGIDLNPVLALPSGAFALDALIAKD